VYEQFSAEMRFGGGGEDRGGYAAYVGVGVACGRFGAKVVMPLKEPLTARVSRMGTGIADTDGG